MEIDLMMGRGNFHPQSMNIAAFSIKRPILITSIVMLSVITGYISMKSLGVDIFPDVNIPVVVVNTVYTGAGPEEVENLISRPLEEELASISGLKRIRSTSQEGYSVVVAEFNLSTDIIWAEQEVRTRVSKARRTLPSDIEEPLIQRIDPADQPVLILSLTADLSAGELYDLADERIKPFFEQIPGVGAVKILGGTRREVQIELDRTKLNARLIPAVAVQKALGNYGSNTPVGKFESGAKETSFRAVGRFETLSQIENAAVVFSGDLGNAIRIKDLGTVRDGTEDEMTIARLYGPIENVEPPHEGFFSHFVGSEFDPKKLKRDSRPALFLQVYKQSGSNTVNVVDSSIARMDKLNSEINGLSGKPAITMVRDGAKPIRINVEDVTESIFLGILLTVVVVYFFLGNLRSTIITGLAIPNSLLGAFILMAVMGFTLNVVSLLALSLSIGLLVDDAIVVRENIFRKLEHGYGAVESAIRGTMEVSLAVIATTATVVAVFLPVGFLGGIVGQFLRQLGFTVVFAMIVSLFDAMTVAPLLSAYFAGKVNLKPNIVIRMFDKFQTFLETIYGIIMKFTLRRPLFVIALTLIFFLLSIVSLRFVKNSFMPPNDFGEFMVSISMPPGTSLQGTDKTSKKIQEAIIANVPEIDKISTVVGTEYGDTNSAILTVMLVESKYRKRNTTVVKDQIRNILKEFEYARPSVNDISLVGGGVQYPLNLLIKGDNLDELDQYSQKVIQKLSEIDDLIDVDTDFRSGKPEFQIFLDPIRMQMVGVAPGMAGYELRLHVAGDVVSKFYQNGLEYDVRMRLKPEQRNLRSAFDQTKIPNMSSYPQMIPLSFISKGKMSEGPLRIDRQDRSRVIVVHGNLATGGAIGNATEQALKILQEELPPPPGVSYAFVGQSEDLKELQNNILVGFGMALIFIYLVLSSLYESFITPITILAAIPWAISGAFFALAFTGEMLNLFSMIGLILLMGLVTKNSILLVDFAMEGMRSGMTRDEAIYQAGLVRLRPIFMTSLAMIAGMLPIALGLNEASKSRTSMGIAIIGGLIVSTVVTLVVVPAIFGYIDRLRNWIESGFRLQEGTEYLEEGAIKDLEGHH